MLKHFLNKSIKFFMKIVPFQSTLPAMGTWSILFYPTGSSEYIVRFDGSGNRLQFFRMRV